MHILLCDLHSFITMTPEGNMREMTTFTPPLMSLHLASPSLPLCFSPPFFCLMFYIPGDIPLPFSPHLFSRLLCSPVISKLPSPPTFSRLNLPLQLSVLHSPGLLAVINSVHHPHNPHLSPAENMTIFSTGDIQRVNKTVVSASH